MKWPYGPVGTEGTRKFRNLLNKIFGDIEFDMRDILSRINILNKRIANLILNKSDLPEIVDARMRYDGNLFDVLYDHFADTDRKLDSLLEDVDFDITKQNARFITGISGIRNAVNQSVNVDPQTMELYSTQSDSYTPEGFYITRMTPSGNYVSSMWIPNGGHGTMVGLDRRTNGSLMFWITHVGSNKLIFVPYKDDYVLTEAEVSELADFKPSTLANNYFTPSYDPYFDYMCFRRDDGIVELRKRADIVNKVNNVLYSVNIDPAENVTDRPMQGCVSYGPDVYWLSGAATNTTKIQKYDAKTNQKIVDYDLNDLVGENGNLMFRDNYREPEGLAYYVNPLTGKHTLLFVITSGDIGKRFNMLYGISQRGDNGLWESLARLGSQNYAFTKGDGRSLSIPTGITSINQLTKSGYYYMDAATSNSLKDFPYPQGGAGWYVFVSPTTQVMGGIQRLIRSSTGRKLFTIERTFNLDRKTFQYSFGEWTVNTNTSTAQEAITASDWENKLSNVLLAGEYYITSAQMALFIDVPTEMKDAGGRLFVYAGDNGGSVRQVIIRNSNNAIEEHVRNVIIETKMPAGNWLSFRHTGSLSYAVMELTGGATNPDEESKWRAANDGKNIIIRGAVTVPVLPTATKIATLPNGWKPTMVWEEEQLGVKFSFQTDGSIEATNTSESTVDVRINTLVPIY